VRVPLEAAVGRLGGVAVQTGEAQRGGADPGAVVVAAGQEHRPVPDHGVEVGGERSGRPERGHRPAAAEHPPGPGARGVAAHRVEVLGRLAELGEVAPVALEPGLHGMHVRVLEARQHQPPVEVDDLGAPADLGAQVRLGHDVDHPSVGDDEAVAGQVGAAVEDVAGGEHQDAHGIQSAFGISRHASPSRVR
jgi:hypothetical protein